MVLKDFLMWALVLKKDENLLKVCEDIKKRDSTFNYSVKDNFIIIYCKTRDEAYKKGYWFKFKAGAKNFDIVVVK